jgi:ubiquinone/menaquinone biosynthesis C-methylase UbiE
MLDIGIGGGRTTYHFASLTKEYVGIDCSDNMVKACGERFANASNVSFLTCDARRMKLFEDDCFDFVLFSANGINTLDHEARMEALGEIRRVCKKEGVFCFSSLNLNGIGKFFSFTEGVSELFSVHGYFHLKTLMALSEKMATAFLTRFLNPSPRQLENVPYAVLFDGVWWPWFFSWNYYIRPEQQIRQLAEIGFQNVRIFSLNGEEIKDWSNSQLVTDQWLYYLCEA